MYFSTNISGEHVLYLMYPNSPVEGIKRAGARWRRFIPNKRQFTVGRNCPLFLRLLVRFCSPYYYSTGTVQSCLQCSDC
jgi:hypothetical protein